MLWDDGTLVPLIDGYLLVQGRQADSSYADVTLEWLNLGIARENPNAVLKFQQIHDHTPPDGVTESSHPLDDPDDHYPLNLYDTREGEVRNAVAYTTTCALGGIMNIVELDVDNLRQWLLGNIGTTGTQVESVSQNGYLFYFSDRRGMLPNGGGDVVGEYGYEDLINSTIINGLPDAILETSEDVNQSGALDIYGAANLGDGFGQAGQPPTFRISCNDAWKKRVSGARHALKLVNGSLGNLPHPRVLCGQRESRLRAGRLQRQRPVSVILMRQLPLLLMESPFFPTIGGTGEASDFLTPPAGRPATSTWYRVAVATGKNLTWANPSWSPNVNDGLDGGVRYLLRRLEGWPVGQTFNYKGSLASLFYSQYAVGVYKCCTSVFLVTIPSNYSFDTDFLDPSNLPPGTPRLQDIVALGFRQLFSSN